MTCYPFWDNLKRWSGFYHFNYIVFSHQKKHPILERIKNFLVITINVLKITSLPLYMRLYSSTKFNHLIYLITWHYITLEFIGIKFLILPLLIFGIYFVIKMGFCIKNRDYFIQRKLATNIAFVLKLVVPVFFHYSGSFLSASITEYLNYGEPISNMVLSAIIFVLYGFLYWYNCLFGGKTLSTLSYVLTPWNEMYNFYTILLSNVVMLLWDISFIKGFDCTLETLWVIGLVILFGRLYVTSLIPMITPESNITDISETGYSITFIIILELIFRAKMNMYLGIAFSTLAYFLWKLYIAPIFFRFYCSKMVKRFKFDPENLFDIENYIQLPDISPRNFQILLHYLIIEKYQDISALMIAVIDSDRDTDLTVECGRLLFMLSLTPSSVRDKLFLLDPNSVSLRSRQLLCDIQHEINKINTLQEDVEEYMPFLEDYKLKAKISLYALVNALLDGDKYTKLVKAINFVLVSQTYRSIADYFIESVPQAVDIINSYADYLKKYAGDYIVYWKLVDQMNRIKSGKFSLFVTNEAQTLSDKIEDQQEEKSNDKAQVISAQNAVDSIRSLSGDFLVFLCVLIVFILFLPFMTKNSNLERDGFVHYEYFNYAHMPAHFMLMYTLSNIGYYYRYHDWALGEKNYTLSTVYGIHGYNYMRNYLDNINCPCDDMPVLRATSEEASHFASTFYNMTSMRYITVEIDDSASPPNTMHMQLEDMYIIFESMTERYKMCAQQFSNQISFIFLYAIIGLAVLLFALYIYVIFRTVKFDTAGILEVLSGIESQTLEEFRSNLFVGIHAKHTKPVDEIDTVDDIDNDGALELDEIEAEEVNHVGQNNYAAEIDSSLNAKLMVKKYDPTFYKMYIVYVFILFVLHIVIYLGSVFGLNAMYQTSVDSSVWMTDVVESSASLFMSIDALLNYKDMGECYPHKVVLNETTSIPAGSMPQKVKTDITKIFENWNNYLDSIEGLTPDQIDLQSIFEHSYQTIEETAETIIYLYDNAYTFYVDTNPFYVETVFWVVNDIIVLIYIIISYLFIARFYLYFSQLKCLALVIQSHTSSVLAILMNKFDLTSKNSSKFDIYSVSELIIAQIKDPIIIFDIDNNILSLNQQAAAQFNFTTTKYQGTSITNIFPRDLNRDFYDFIRAMTTPYGIRVRRIFDMTSVSPKGNKVLFTSTLFPLNVDGGLFFAVLMRDQTHIKEMEQELSFLRRRIASLLKRLVPKEVAVKLMVENASTIAKVDVASVFAISLKQFRDYGEKFEELDIADITDVCISEMDKNLAQFPGIVRLRSFNGMFFFICGLYPPLPPNQQIQSLCQFAQSCAPVINKFLCYDILLSGVIATGGPVFSGCIGLSHTLFDVWGDPVDEVFPLLQIVPPGSIILTEASYHAMEEGKDAFSEIEYGEDENSLKKLYIMELEDVRMRFPIDENYQEEEQVLEPPNDTQ